MTSACIVTKEHIIEGISGAVNERTEDLSDERKMLVFEKQDSIHWKQTVCLHGNQKKPRTLILRTDISSGFAGSFGKPWTGLSRV